VTRQRKANAALWSRFDTKIAASAAILASNALPWAGQRKTGAGRPVTGLSRASRLSVMRNPLVNGPNEAAGAV
jgi:hypothetical protein